MLVSANCYGTGGGNNHSLAGSVSTNGRYAVFQSDASDLLPGDTNGVTDIFVRDLQAATNILVSVATDGSWANGASTSPVMTPDGCYVAFVSAATNLAAGVTNGIPNVFVRDLVNGTTTWVTTNSTGLNAVVSSPVITLDGRYVAFFSTATGMVTGVSAATGGEIYLYDSVSNKMTWASTNAASIVATQLNLNNAPSSHPALSADGRYVAFKAGWTNGTTSPGGSGVAAVLFFQYDASNRTTTVVSTNGYAPWLNCDDVYGPEMSPDGRFVAFVQREQAGSGTNSDVRLWDRVAGTNVLVSVNLNGLWPTNSNSHTPAVSADGRYVTFLSNATNLVSNAITSNSVHLYRRDLQTATTVLVDADINGVGSQDEVGTIPALSADGSRVCFTALDGALVALDNNNAQDVFLWDATAGTNTMISVNNPLAASQSASGESSLGQYSLSGNGKLAAFASFARDLVANDFNGDADVFVHDFLANTNMLVSVGLDGNAGQGGGSFSPVISADGRYVVFASGATNLVANDINGVVDVFRRDLQTGSTALVSVILAGLNSVSGGANSGIYDASYPAISQDGRYVAFLCRTNVSTAMTALFWNDMNSNVTRVIAGSVLNQPITMSANGSRVAYFDTTSRLYVWDANSNGNIYTNSSSGLTSAAISPAGNRLFYQFSGGLFIYDLSAKTNLFICLSKVPIKSPGQWSGDGRYVAFVTATNLVSGDNNGTNDVYLLDYQTGTLTLVSVDQTGMASAAGVSDSPMISEDGRFVAFRSFATNVLPGIVTPPSLFLFDRLAGTNSLLATGTLETGWTTWFAQPVLSMDASRLAFQSWDAGLVSGDLNGAGDVFAGDLSGWPALDSDGDGIPDWWMIEFFGHATGQAGDLSRAQDDADGDGMNNLQEFLAGTIPTAQTSVLALHSAMDATGTNIVLNWTAASGKSYQILSATNLSPAVWQVVPESVQAGSAAALGGTRNFSLPATNSPSFFRLQTGN